jgi:hypothetical protein
LSRHPKYGFPQHDHPLCGIGRNELSGPYNSPRGHLNFQFKNGVSDEYLDATQQKNGTPEARAKIAGDSSINLPGGSTVRFLKIGWEHMQGTGSYSVLFGFVCENGRVREIFKFSTDAAEFEIGLGDQLVIKQALCNEKDAHCCPTQARTIYYGWDSDQQKFRQLRVDGPNPLLERP